MGGALDGTAGVALLYNISKYPCSLVFDQSMLLGKEQGLLMGKEIVIG
jgi:hypothetical protein